MPHDEKSATRLLKSLATKVRDLDPAAPSLALALEEVKEDARYALGFLDKRGRGNPRLSQAREKAGEVARARAEKLRAEIRPLIASLRAQGKTSFREIAEGLDAMGVKPPASKKWAPNSVRLIEKDEPAE